MLINIICYELIKPGYVLYPYYYHYFLHKLVRMTMHIIIGFCHAQLCMNDFFIIILFCHAQPCTNDYFIPNFFPMSFCKMGIFSCFLATSARINI